MPQSGRSNTWLGKGFAAWACAMSSHDWQYFEDPDHDYTGYLERCSRCGAITQIPQ